MAEEPTNRGGNGKVPDEIHAATSEIDYTDPDVRALAAELRLLENNILLARATFARATGFTFDNARDTYKVFGYKDLISTSDYRARYQRGGIAGRIVDALPNACWRGEMEIIEDESKEEYTPFEKAWHELDQRLQIKAKLQRVDKLAGLSTYAVLLIGAAGNFEEELPRVKASEVSSKGIIYLSPFMGGGGPTNTNNLQVDRTISTGADATVEEYETDTKSPRFGLPKSYRLRRVGQDATFARPVHWSRIIHIAEGLLDDEVFGLPALERVWNDLDNLDKVAGGGSEAFWLRANQGVHIDIDKDMKLENAKDTLAALKEQVEAYKHGLDRWIRTHGVNVDVLGSDVANFSNPVDTILTLIAGAKGMPKRILTGSEMGELASSQDRDNWKDQINGRQTGYLGPYVVRPLVDRLVAYGYLPAPRKSADAYEVKWPHIQTLTEQEKSTGAGQWAATNASMKNAGLEPVFTGTEIRDKWYAMPPLTDEQKAEIAEAKAAAVQQAQEAMQQNQPPKPEDQVPPQLQRAAAAYVPQPGDEELIEILADAIEAGNADVVARIVGMEPR